MTSYGLALRFTHVTLTLDETHHHSWLKTGGAVPAFRASLVPPGTAAWSLVQLLQVWPWFRPQRHLQLCQGQLQLWAQVPASTSPNSASAPTASSAWVCFSLNRGGLSCYTSPSQGVRCSFSFTGGACLDARIRGLAVGIRGLAARTWSFAAGVRISLGAERSAGSKRPLIVRITVVIRTGLVISAGVVTGMVLSAGAAPAWSSALDSGPVLEVPSPSTCNRCGGRDSACSRSFFQNSQNVKGRRFKAQHSLSEQPRARQEQKRMAEIWLSVWRRAGRPAQRVLWLSTYPLSGTWSVLCAVGDSPWPCLPNLWLKGFAPYRFLARRFCQGLVLRIQVRNNVQVKLLFISTKARRGSGNLNSEPRSDRGRA